MLRSYEMVHRSRTRILCQDGAEAELGAIVQQLEADFVVVVHDDALAELGTRIATTLGAAATIAVPGRETVKRLATVDELAARLHTAGATRASVLVAVGGGSLTDLCGFVASIYLRGIAFVACPTTTLAMCDAALGGKNGVDHSGLKNRLGTIRQPDAIVIDPAWLRSLPDSMFVEGIVEAVKKAAVLDRERFVELEALAAALRRREPEATLRTIEMAIDMKMSVVVADEHERDRRRALNAGHTIGHAIEALAAGSLRHGQAVAMGLVAECRAAGVAADVRERIERLLGAIGVDARTPTGLADPEQLWPLATRDKKSAFGRVPMYVPTELGNGSVVELTPDTLRRAFR